MKKKLLIPILVLSLTVNLAFAAVIYSLEKPCTVYVAVDGEIQLYNIGSSVVSSLDWGRMISGQSKNVSLTLRNNGARYHGVNWTVVGLPSGFSVRAFFGAAQGLWLKDIGLIGIQAGQNLTVTFEIIIGGSVEASKSYGWTLKLTSTG